MINKHNKNAFPCLFCFTLLLIRLTSKTNLRMQELFSLLYMFTNLLIVNHGMLQSTFEYVCTTSNLCVSYFYIKHNLDLFSFINHRVIVDAGKYKSRAANNAKANARGCTSPVRSPILNLVWHSELKILPLAFLRSS